MLFATIATVAPTDPYAALYAALATAVTTLVSIVMAQLARKYSFQVSAERHAQLEAVIENAILLMEEKGKNVLKAGLEGLTPAEKLEGALAYVAEKLPGVSREDAAAVIHAKLPVVRGAIASFAAAAITKQTRKKGGRK